VRRTLHITLVTLSLALLLGATVAAALGADGRKTITVGYGFGIDTNDGADMLGFSNLHRSGIDVKLKELGSPDAAIAALDHGDVQLAKLSSSRALPAIGQGAPIRLVLAADTLHDDLILARPGIKGVADLRGKTLLVSSTRGSSFALAHALLVKAGIPDSAVKFAALRDSEDRVIALQNGRADASVLDTVDWQRLALAGGYTVLGRVLDLEPRSPSSVWAVSPAFIRDDQSEVQKIVTALFKGYQRAYTRPGKTAFVRRANRGPLSGSDPRIAGRAYDWYVKHRYWPRPGAILTPAAYDAVTAWWHDHGILDNPAPPFATAWDLSFWRTAERSYRKR